MKRGTLIKRSLGFHWRSHLGVALGAAVGAAALAGALIVGDSVRESLRQRALERVGRIQHAWTTGDRLFRQELATSVPDAEPALAMLGGATREDGSARANQVNVYGVAPGFFKLGSAKAPELKAGETLINEALASQLKVGPGDLIVLRIRKPSALSADATIAPQSESAVALRLRVGGVVTAKQLGNFSLRANQLPPHNAFLPLDALASAAAAIGKANLIVSAQTVNGTNKLPVTLTDLQLELRATNNVVELRTERIFMEAPILAAATNSAGGTLVPQALPVLTYLANLLQSGSNAAPYSMVTAAGPPWTPTDLRDDEIVINDWLAEDLQTKPAGEVALTYFVADSSAHLIERTNKFRVRSVVQLQGIHGDRTLMPEFPGIAKAESTHDWDAGFPLVHKIRPKDDAYWKTNRGTPKAFITFAAGQQLWANRFGNVTALRWPAEGNAEQLRAAVQENVLRNLAPESVGIQQMPVREQATQAAAQSQDFGGLFIGFSFFLIAAALILMGLLFQFGLEQRMVETGTMLAMGYTPKAVRKLLLLEGLALAAIGSVVGVAVGAIYAMLMLRGLTTVWRSATNATALAFHLTPVTLAAGLCSGMIVGLLTIWLVLRKQARQPARVLLSGDGSTNQSEQRKTRRRWIPSRIGARFVGWVSAIGAAALIGASFASEDGLNAGQFFGAGALLLIAGIAFTSFVLGRVSMGGRRQIDTRGLTVRGAARRRSRSVATVALLASGVFLICAIGAFRLDANRDAWKRESGTGGFALIAQSTLPIVKDLNTADGRESLGLDENLMAKVTVVPFRVREGDDASCLNLNRAQQPRLLGVDQALLAGRFSFAAAAKGVNKQNGWAALKRGALERSRGTEVPGIGDAASIKYALGQNVGGTLTMRDERGSDLPLKLVGGVANSILQGALILNERDLVERFPSASGYRMFLIDCPSNAVAEVSAELSRALQDYGFEVTSAAERLEAFNAVQNTYLGTFQVLGGLGMLLGSVGLGILVLRNVLERRGELALLLAVGYRPGRLKRLVLAEHAALLAAGLLIGMVAAALAVLPGVLTRAELPAVSLAMTVAAIACFGLASTWLATRAAVKGNLLEGLRNE